MSIIDSNEKFFVFGLMMKCPEGEPLIDCPLGRYRKLSIQERVKLVEKLSEKEINELKKYHHECLLRRIKNT